MEYLVRSSKKEKKIDIFVIEEGKKKQVAFLENDLILDGVVRLPLKVGIKNLRGKVIGYLETFYPQEEQVQILNNKSRGLSRLVSGKDVLVGSRSFLGGRKTFKRLSKKELQKIEGEGLTQAFAFGKKVYVYCFEKDGEMAGIIRGGTKFLEFLPLIVSERVFRQELVKQLLA